MFFLVPAFTFVGFVGIIIGFCIIIHQDPARRSDGRLRLRGLSRGPSRRPQVESTRFRMDDHTKYMMNALRENGMEHETAPRLVARLQWWNQLNHFLDMLHNTEESIQNVTTGITVLMNYHELHQEEVEEDFVNLVFSRVLQDGNLSHLYAKLFKRLRKGNDKDWTQNIVRRLFQLCVDEFNTPYPDGEERALVKCRRANNVKLMASMFKREMPGVPDDWITDCADSLIHRVDQDVNEQTVQELHLFVKTLLLPEPGENCDPIHPTRQRQLLACFDAIERAASPRKIQPPSAIEKFHDKSDAKDEDVATDGCEGDSESNSKSDTENPHSSTSLSDSGSECEHCSDGYEDEVDTDTDRNDTEGYKRCDSGMKPEIEKKTVKPTGLIEGIIIWIKNAMNEKAMAKKKFEDEEKARMDQIQAEIDEMTARKLAEDEIIMQEFRADMRRKTAAAAERRILKNRIRYPVFVRRN